ncbi:MAG: ComEC/Rec2 family competence protein [Patescibacteria group bacterium]
MARMIRTQFKLIILCIGVLVGALIIDRVYHELYAPKLLEVVVLDVGQGSSAYVASPEGYELLLDTGPSMEGVRALWRYRFFIDRYIDELIISHGDRDHMAMTPYFIKNFNLGRISWAPFEFDGAMHTTVQKLVEEYNQNTKIVDAPEMYQIGENLTLEILWPQKEYQGRGRNNHSVVARVRYQDMDFLFPGDIEESVEARLVDIYGEQLASEVLVLAHHGSKTSSSMAFLQAVDPELAIVSVGSDNPYGHPHEQVLTRLRHLRIPLVSTAQMGDIVLLSDGQKIIMETPSFNK